MSSVVSRAVTSEHQSQPMLQQALSNGSYQEASLSETQTAKRQPTPPKAVSATVPAKPQRRQHAVPQYGRTVAFCSSFARHISTSVGVAV